MLTVKSTPSKVYLPTYSIASGTAKCDKTKCQQFSNRILNSKKKVSTYDFQAHRLWEKMKDRYDEFHQILFYPILVLVLGGIVYQYQPNISLPSSSRFCLHHTMQHYLVVLPTDRRPSLITNSVPGQILQSARAITCLSFHPEKIHPLEK